MPSKYAVAVGSIAAGMLVAAPGAGAVTTTFSNSTPITIADAVAPGVPTLATPYPSTVSVPQLAVQPGTTPKVLVALNGLSHTSPADIDATINGPAGQTVLLNDTGGTSIPASGANLTFVTTPGTTGLARIPFAGPVVTGTYLPSNYQGGVEQPSGQSNYAAGNWSLLVQDDAPADEGVIAGGFSVTVDYVPSSVSTAGAVKVNKRKGTATLAVTVPNPGTLTLAKTSSYGAATIAAPAAGTYNVPIKARGKSLKKLKKKGKVKLSVSLQFLATGSTQSYSLPAKSVTLKKTKKRK